MRKIVSTADTNSGSPRIEGTRLTCANVAQSLWYNDHHSLAEYLKAYPNLTRADILAALEYCGNKQCVGDCVISFCEQCTLDKQPREDQPSDENDNHPREDIWILSQQLLVRYQD